MTDVNLDILSRPFPEHAIKARDGGGGKSLSYVDGATVIRRLIEATGNTYSFAIIPEATQFLDGGVDKYGKPEQIMLVLGSLTLPDIGTRMAFGVQRFKNPIQNADDLLKAAATDALKKAASLFGVALELYGPDLEAQEPSAEQSTPTPIRRQDASLKRIEEVAGAHTVPERAPSNPKPAQAPQPTTTQNGTTRPSHAYGDSAPRPCNTQTLSDYCKENGFAGGDMGACIKQAEEWVTTNFPGNPRVVSTGDYDAKYKRHKTYPSDVWNYLSYHLAQCDDPGDPAVTAAAGGVSLTDDEIPF